MRATFEQRARLCAERQELTGAGASTPTRPLIDEVERSLLVRPRRRRKPDRVTDNLLCDRDFSDDVMEAQHIFAVEQSLDRNRGRRGGSHNHGYLVIFRQIIHNHVEHETIELDYLPED